VIYLAFGFEAVNTQADRDTLMRRALEWLAESTWPDIESPGITLHSPNGVPEAWLIDSEEEVSWSASDNSGACSVDLYLSRDGGNTFAETLATGEANDGSFLWPVTGPATSDAKIMVIAYDARGNCSADTSDSGFVIKDLVDVALQSYDSRWAGDHVEVTWLLSDLGPRVTFAVSRRESRSGRERYEPVPDPEIARNEDEFIFRDRTATPGRTYSYRVVVVENAEVATTFETTISVPSVAFALEQNHPNPFNPTTTISFTLPEKVHANLSIYNIEGKLVRTLVDDVMDAGSKNVTWDGTAAPGKPVSSGVYFYRLKAGKEVLTRKMVLIQ
jgi:hypothetical protein